MIEIPRGVSSRILFSALAASLAVSLFTQPYALLADDGVVGSQAPPATVSAVETDRFNDLAGKYLCWIQLYTDAAFLSRIYFEFTPSSASDLADKGLVPFAPKFWDTETNEFLNQFFSIYPFPDPGSLAHEDPNTWAPDTMLALKELRQRIKPVPLDEATPERILAYRWQLLARMPQSFANYNLKGSNAVFFKCGTYGLFLSEPSKNYGGFGGKVNAFWTNPYTGERARRNTLGDENTNKGDLVFLPGSEYIRLYRPEDMDRLHDFYYREAFIWVGADPNYGIE